MNFNGRTSKVPSSSPRSEEPSSLSLRDRLRIQDTPDTELPTKHVRYQDMYGQFQAYFKVDLPEPGLEKKLNQKKEEAVIEERLQESFARTGMDLHATAVEKLVQVHTDFEARISRLSDESTRVRNDCAELYSNIAYPLSKTLCSSAHFPRATISAHLIKLQKDLKSAQDDIATLSYEWEACRQAETEIWSELNKVTAATYDTDVDKENARVGQEFKRRARQITTEKCEETTRIDMRYMEEIRHARQEILMLMMKDD